jgi:hypothetical protein
LPSLSAAYEELRVRGLEVRFVNFREEPGVVRKAVEERGYRPPVLIDRSGEVTGRAYGVWAPPTVYLIDRQGRLVGRVVGTRGWDSREARVFLQALLDAK